MKNFCPLLFLRGHLTPKHGRRVCVEVKASRLFGANATVDPLGSPVRAGCLSSLPDRPPPCPGTFVCFEPESRDSGGLLPPPRCVLAVVRRPFCPPPCVPLESTSVGWKGYCRASDPGGLRVVPRPQAHGLKRDGRQLGHVHAERLTRRTGDRSPGASGSPAPLESVDGWPLATPDAEIPGGSRPVVSAVRRRARGVRSLHPRAICRSQPPPARATRLEPLRVGLVSRGLVGAIGWSSASSPGAPGLPRRPGASLRPFLISQLSPPSAGGLGPPDGRASCRSSGVPDKLVIWLILPVVICLSQRLSHACLSISNLYCETANGSLNQLSFI